jgi:hypothetical protein
MAKKSGNNKTRSDPKKIAKTVSTVVKVAALGYAGYQVVTNPLGVVRFLFNIYQTTNSRTVSTNPSVDKYGLTNTHVPENPRPSTGEIQPHSRAWIINDYYLTANAKRDSHNVPVVKSEHLTKGGSGPMQLEFLK